MISHPYGSVPPGRFVEVDLLRMPLLCWWPYMPHDLLKTCYPLVPGRRPTKNLYIDRSPRKWVENVPKKGLQFNFRKFHQTQPLTFFQPLICWRRTGEWEIDGHLYYTWDPGSPNVRWCWKSGCIWSPPKRNARCLASISILSFGDWIVRE